MQKISLREYFEKNVFDNKVRYNASIPIIVKAILETIADNENASFLSKNVNMSDVLTSIVISAFERKLSELPLAKTDMLIKELTEKVANIDSE